MTIPSNSSAPEAPTQSSLLRPVASITEWFQKITTWIRGLTPAWATTYESPFENIEVTASGMTGTISFSRIGKWVIVQGEVIGQFPEGPVVLGEMPTNLVPIGGNARGSAYFGGGYPGCSYVSMARQVGVTHCTGAPRNNPSFTVVYRIY